jgi:Icc-related predicted phosphoesterase
LVGTDFHGSEEAFRGFASKAEDTKAEILVICGDITHFGSLQEARSLLSLLAGLRLPVYFVPGNCDPPSLATMEVEGASCIHGSYESYDEVTFFGLGGGPISPFSTPFEMTEEEIAEFLTSKAKRSLATRIFILVSHTPPKDTKLDRIFSGTNVGSEYVRKFIEEREPSAVFCGHIHEARGVDKIGKTILVNPGPARHGYCGLVSVNERIEVKLDYM